MHVSVELRDPAIIQKCNPSSIYTLSGSTRSGARIQFRRSFDLKGGTLNFNPRFDIQNIQGDFTVGYSLNDVSVFMDASRSKQRFSFSKLFGEKTQVTPTVSLQGDMSLAIKQKLTENDGSISAVLKPKESASIIFEEGPWVASLVAPMQGYLFAGGVDVNVKRRVDFF